MTISIIIPAFNEERLIESTVKSISEYLLSTFNKGEIIIVNDGSTDNTLAVLTKLITEYRGKIELRLINNQENRGKGYSIRQGILQSKGKVRIFMDADLPFRLDAISKIHKRIVNGIDIVIGDRNDPESELVNVHAIRKLAGAVYSNFVQLLISGGITDTQCGLKGFSANVAKFIFSRTTINGFGFDAEVLRIGQKHSFSIARLPVRMENNRSKSRVHLVKDSLQMLWNLAVIKRNEKMGLYD